MKVVDRTGQRYGLLTVIKRAGSKRGQATWFCICDCGNKVVIPLSKKRKTCSWRCSSIYRWDKQGRTPIEKKQEGNRRRNRKYARSQKGKETKKRYRETYNARRKEYDRRYVTKHPEKRKESASKYSRDQVRNLSDIYIKGILRKEGILKPSVKLITVRRTLIALKRRFTQEEITYFGGTAR